VARLLAAERGLLVPLDGKTPPVPPGGGGSGGGGGGGGGGGTPPPSGTGMLFGASVSRGRSAFNTIRTQAGPWSCARSYNSGAIPTTFAGSAAGPDVGSLASIWSAKPDMTSMSNGTLDVPTEAFLASIPDSHPCVVCIWHEPDVKLRSTSGLNVPLWQSATARFLSMVRASGKPNLYGSIIFTNWSLIGGVTKGVPDDFWLPGWENLVDVVGWDLYDLHTSPNTDANHELKPCRDWCDTKGVAWGIGEIGVRAAVTDHVVATSWLSDKFDYALTHGSGQHPGSAAFTCMFDYTASAPNVPVPSGDQHFIDLSKAFGTANNLPYASFVL
jgi:hypothetical protein